MFYKRHAEETIRKLEAMFGAVLVTGARQVGKTTLLKEVAKAANYVTLDDPIMLATAIELGGTFFKDNPPPVFVDEIQYAANLFPHIKIILDRDKKKGQFFLSGSQQFHMMKNITESLAGRLGIMVLPGLSLREINNSSFTEPFIPTDEYFSTRRADAVSVSYDQVWNSIQRGFMPELCANPEFDWRVFYGSYVKTYIERDVRDLTQVGDELKFAQFMTVAASHTGRLLNIASIARDVGVSQPTAERWLSIMVTSNLVYLLRPYHNNITKRTVKTPKIYFLDTGLAAYLTRWNTPDVLKSGAMAGAFFETFVISEIIKGYANKGISDYPIYFYRDRDGNEIDLLISEGNILYPIEIKKHADPDKSDVAKFDILNKITGIIRGQGGVVCLYDNLVTIRGNDKSIPVSFL